MDLNMPDSVGTQWSRIMDMNNKIIQDQIIPAYRDKIR